MTEMAKMTNTLIISNNVQEENLDTIANFFEKYKLGKPLSITYNNENKSAILKLEFWYDNVCANNMYDRMVESGEAKIVYDDPEYFTVQFYNDEEENVDYRDEYLANENRVDDYSEVDSTDHREDYVASENQIDYHYEDDNKPSETENVSYAETSDVDLNNRFVREDSEESDVSESDDEYLEDDVIENTNNIEMLFDIIKEMSKKMKTIERRIGNISKKTSILYKERPHVVKRSVWEGRLRFR